jgi:multiple sugar transport system substrate-binding protein
MLALMAAGTPPDVWDIGQGVFNEYEKRGEALALDPLIARDKWVDFADFEPSSMYLLRGKRHMLPRDTGVSCLYYNAEHWQRAGLPNPRQLWLEKKWDWAAFLDAARRLTGSDPAGRRYGIGVVGAAPWTLGAWLWQNGTDFGDWAANKQTIDRPASIEALQFVIDLAQRHQVMPTPAAASAEGPTFENGRLAMQMAFSFGRGAYMRMQNVRWDVAPLPRGKAGAAVHVARNGFAISTKSKQREAAWLWLTHITGKEVCRLATQEGRVHPPRKSVANSDVFLRPPGVTADFRPFVEQQPFGQFGAPHEKRGELTTLLERRVPAAYNGELSAQALATELAPQIQQLLVQGEGYPDPKK